MITNNNGIFKWVYDIFKIKGESAPVFVEDFIQPVIDVTPIITESFYNASINSTTQIILTTPTDRDFYITNAQLSLIKDATSTSAYTNINCTVNGKSIRLLQIMSITLTAQSETISQCFQRPIKIDRGTTINISNTANVANIAASGIIQGYYVE